MNNEGKVVIGIGILTLAIFIAIVAFGSNSRPTKIEPKAVESPSITRDDSHKTGSGTVTVTEFGDFQCPACGAAFPVLEQARQAYAGKITFVFRNLPLMSIHPNALLAAQAAEAAAKQGKFWEMHDKLFLNQDNWSSSLNPESTFTSYASELKLDTKQFKKDLGSSSIADRIALDLGDAEALGLSSTPSIFVNGKAIDASQSLPDALHTAIEAELAS